MANAADEMVVARRIIRAPVAQVYRAWSDPAVAARWGWGRDHETLSVELDCRPGGVWRHRVRNRTNGVVWEFTGRFETVEPERRIVHTFEWTSDSGEHEPESLVTVELTAVPEGTAVEITHTRLRPSSVDGTTEGWQDCLEQIASATESP